ncbi:MAG TPA: hypothetical protein VF221_16730, partial [Chloroflexota bacterium]
DFVRGISPEGDVARYADELTRPLPEGDDLRYIVRNGGVDIGVFAERLPWDTEFFGYGVAKLNEVFVLSDHAAGEAEYTAALQVMLDAALQTGITYLFGAIEPRDLPALRALGNLGFTLIETRAYYHMSLGDFDSPKRFPVRLATPEDVTSTQYAARTAVNAYDRFHADPFLAPAADRLMDRWLEASILEGFADATIVPDAPNPTAFCTVRYHRDMWPVWKMNLAQPVLSAVTPEYKGWYRKLISEVNYHLMSIGAEHSYLCTQITNRAVIRVWESLGYRFGRGEHIFRILL